jgi:hypothetical protein
VNAIDRATETGYANAVALNGDKVSNILIEEIFTRAVQGLFSSFDHTNEEWRS